jgi:hypothetical protein
MFTQLHDHQITRGLVGDVELHNGLTAEKQNPNISSGAQREATVDRDGVGRM